MSTTPINATIEQLIQDRYGLDSALTALVSSDRFLTGSAQEESIDRLPACVLTKQSQSAQARTTSGRIDQASLRFQAWHRSFDTGSEFVQRLLKRFENAAWEDSGVVVNSMRYTNDFSLQEPDGTWQFVVDFDATFQRRYEL